MDRREVERRNGEALRARAAIEKFVREHNAALSVMLQEAARLETLYTEARRELHAELDAQRR